MSENAQDDPSSRMLPQNAQEEYAWYCQGACEEYGLPFYSLAEITVHMETVFSDNKMPLLLSRIRQLYNEIVHQQFISGGWDSPDTPGYVEDRNRQSELTKQLSVLEGIFLAPVQHGHLYVRLKAEAKSIFFTAINNACQEFGISGCRQG